MDYINELAFAKRMAFEAGRIMKKYYRADQQVTTKPDHTPVTVADTEVNQLIVDQVKMTFPEYGVLGEEISYQSDREKLWVCDPIDGTPAFIYHIPTSMFSLALVVGGVPQLGVAFNPLTSELYYAVKGKGAFRDDQAIKVAARAWGEGTRLAGSSDGSLDRHTARDGFKELDISVIASYSIVFKGCLVAEGSVDGRIWGGNGAHDVAAIKLIVEEAGGKATDLDGNEQRYDQPVNGIVMSNGLIHDKLIEIAKASQ
jgi:fructose-1,6-bisphosphatase/inositol monophosphatase family enzyme